MFYYETNNGIFQTDDIGSFHSTSKRAHLIRFVAKRNCWMLYSKLTQDIDQKLLHSHTNVDTYTIAHTMRYHQFLKVYFILFFSFSLFRLLLWFRFGKKKKTKRKIKWTNSEKGKLFPMVLEAFIIIFADKCCSINSGRACKMHCHRWLE